MWLARQGWEVTAVDGAPAAIESLNLRARNLGVTVNAQVADLEADNFRMEPAAWNLICICYYLQRNLFEPAKKGLAPGGVLISVVHLSENNEPATEHRLLPGQLIEYFRDFKILHAFEGMPDDPAHRRAVAEIVARKPIGG